MEKERSKKTKKEDKKKKVPKEKKVMPKAEFLFNLISLVIVIAIGIYFGARSIYYYSLHTNASKKESGTLVEKILEENTITKEKSGLYQKEDGYLFVGDVDNNYVLFSNRLFRILKNNEDHSVKLVSEENQTILPLGDVQTYEGSNLDIWLNKNEQIQNSGIYYNSLSDAYNNLVKTQYCEATFKNNKVICSGKTKKSYVTLLSIEDYMNASGKDSFLNNGSYTWLLGNQNGAFLYMSDQGQVGVSSFDEGYGVRPVITLDSRMKYKGGNGKLESPYQVEESNPTKIGSYVLLGSDTYRIYKEDEQLYYLSLDGYLKVNNEEVVLSYDKSTTKYDPNTRGNIAYVLNNTYLYRLPYQALLEEFPVYTGEISQEQGFTYLNQYNDSTHVKMGLLSIADLKFNHELTDYYLSNTTSSVGDSGYIHDQTGLLKEGNIKTAKHLVLTVAIKKDILKQGDGTKENPWKVE